MLVIGSSMRIDGLLQLSTNSHSPVPKDAFYIEINDARLDSSSKSITTHVYIIIPCELYAIVNGANVITIKGYKLEEQKRGSNDDYAIFKAVQTKEDDSTDLIVNSNIYLELNIGYELNCNLAKDWLLCWSSKNTIRFKKGKNICIDSNDLPREYEGTPAECLRWSIPSLR